MKRSLSGKSIREIEGFLHTEMKNAPAPQEIQAAIERYTGKDEETLMSDLKRVGKESNMNAQDMQQLASQIAPLLSAKQRQRMQEVLKKLREQ